ncbi:MAG TPA: hypothetical protein VNY24_15275 [Candidatus Acidoferrales bacterium]|nr:hypothetical protein [Candidatus Acidoferrales bacterium]
MNKPETLTLHQRAVGALLEVAVFTPELCAKLPEMESSVPRSQVPALFRAAIEEQKGKRGRNEHEEETAILEHALMLLEQAPDEGRTPEQEEFFAALAFASLGNLKFRVKYAPENVTVN